LFQERITCELLAQSTHFGATKNSVAIRAISSLSQVSRNLFSIIGMETSKEIVEITTKMRRYESESADAELLVVDAELD